jgi:hypothetical protein
VNERIGWIFQRACEWKRFCARHAISAPGKESVAAFAAAIDYSASPVSVIFVASASAIPVKRAVDQLLPGDEIRFEVHAVKATLAGDCRY